MVVVIKPLNYLRKIGRVVYSSGLENRRAFTALRQFESGIFRKELTNNEGNIRNNKRLYGTLKNGAWWNNSEFLASLHHSLQPKEVTVGNHKSIIKEWEVKTLLVELYGIVECKLLGFKWSVRLAGPGREIFILKITGSNPVPTTLANIAQLIEH